MIAIVNAELYRLRKRKSIYHTLFWVFVYFVGLSLVQKRLILVGYSWDLTSSVSSGVNSTLYGLNTCFNLSLLLLPLFCFFIADDYTYRVVDVYIGRGVSKATLYACKFFIITMLTSACVFIYIFMTFFINTLVYGAGDSISVGVFFQNIFGVAVIHMALWGVWNAYTLIVIELTKNKNSFIVLYLVSVFLGNYMTMMGAVSNRFYFVKFGTVQYWMDASANFYSFNMELVMGVCGYVLSFGVMAFLFLAKLLKTKA